MMNERNEATGTTTATSSEGSTASSTSQNVPGRLIGPFGIQPAHVLFVASLPVCIGAYAGFRKQAKAAEEEAKEAAVRKAAGKKPRMTTDGRMLGARALGIGTMIAVGSFGVLTAVALYAGGFRSIGEAVDASRRYGRKRRLQLENWTGGIELSKNDPDKIATKGMSEEEELNYVLKNYFPDDMLKEPDENSSKK